MIHEAAVLLHGSTEELLFAEYLYRVGLYLLAVGAVAAGVHWLTAVGGRASAETVGEESDR